MKIEYTLILCASTLNYCYGSTKAGDDALAAAQAVKAALFAVPTAGTFAAEAKKCADAAEPVTKFWTKTKVEYGNAKTTATDKYNEFVIADAGKGEFAKQRDSIKKLLLKLGTKFSSTTDKSNLDDDSKWKVDAFDQVVDNFDVKATLTTMTVAIKDTTNDPDALLLTAIQTITTDWKDNVKKALETLVAARKAEVSKGLVVINEAKTFFENVAKTLLQFSAADSDLHKNAKERSDAVVDETVFKAIETEQEAFNSAFEKFKKAREDFEAQFLATHEANNESIGAAESVVIAMTPPDLTNIDPINVNEPLFPMAQEEKKEDKEEIIAEADEEKEDGSGAEMLYPVLFATCGAIATTIAFFL